MVRKGEYLERAVAFPGDAGALEGLYHRGGRAPPLLIAPQHPFGGSMESPLIAELAWAVTRRGHATLRFNYRGVGASAGDFDEGQGAIADARAALEHLRATVYGDDSEPSASEDESGKRSAQRGEAERRAGRRIHSAGTRPVRPVALLGVGLGAGVIASLAANEDAASLSIAILLAPDLDRLPESIGSLSAELVVITAHHEEPSKIDALRAIVGRVPHGRLTVIPRADRGFLRGLVDLGRVVADAVDGAAA